MIEHDGHTSAWDGVTLTLTREQARDVEQVVHMTLQMWVVSDEQRQNLQAVRDDITAKLGA